ncbi:MAG: selenocysteine-specific translation elongation factor, partial [Synergistaceae bacterium]|nr:selenocysteine-specific translation elongation factor [Synergistaceae bacterium]
MSDIKDVKEISLVLGTAGHIDHGKTTLIAALSGIDAGKLDRLSEEKKRGITIELGFAPLELDDGRVVSVIDVPGHEKFIRQMVAGASGIDAALLVIAADESVMPQTREHLAIMELLGVHDGLIAVTKIDRIKDEPELLELAVEDIKDFVRGTFLEGKPVVPVSGVTGENLDLLRSEIANLINRVKPRPRSGALFLPVDRAFPISGFGTVITGTAYHGTVNVSDDIDVLPSGLRGKIRTLQVHGNSVTQAYAGQRVAANLSNIAVDDLKRGDVICSHGVYAATSCFDAVITLLDNIEQPLKHWQRVHVCIGTSEVLAHVSLLNLKQVAKGQQAPAQLVLEEPIVCAYNQKFILRFYSPLITIGGGTVIYPYSRKPRGMKARLKTLGRIEALRNAETVSKRLESLVLDLGSLDVKTAAVNVQETQNNLINIADKLVKQNKFLELKGDINIYISHERYKELCEILLNAVRKYHKDFPAEAGMPVNNALKLEEFSDAKILKSLINLMADNKLIIAEENKLRLPEFKAQSSGDFEKLANALKDFCNSRAWQLATLDE